MYDTIKINLLVEGGVALKESGEMYLESIYVLCKKSPRVRSVDVAEHMNYSKPSVSRAVGLLRTAGYVTIDNDGCIKLTDLGKKTAKAIFERHTILTRMLIALGVSEQTANEDACKMEHVISDETFTAMKNHLKKYN